MMYEVEALKKDSVYCEHNAIVNLTKAIANKLKLDYKEIHDLQYKETLHEALKPLYEHVDRLAWRIEYLFRAIQNSTEGKNLTPEGGYLQAEFHKYLTTDGRIHAPGVKYKSDFHSISLVDSEGRGMAWANLSFEEIAKLQNHLLYSLKRDYEDLESNIKEFEREIAEGETKDSEDLPEMKANLEAWKKILEKNGGI